MRHLIGERKVINEYAIPENETEIPNDAFNGCVNLKKLIIHSNVSNVGKNFIDGINFKYAYKLENGEVVFSQQLLEKEKYIEKFEYGKLTKTLDGFDSSTILKNDKKELGEFIELSQYLDKQKVKIPYVYACELVKNNKTKNFIENCNLSFFKNELMDINDKLKECSDEEKISFYKFASALGCFSKEKILNKNGEETETYVAQKASSTLRRIVNKEIIKLGEYNEIFNALPLDTKINQEFLKCISEQGEKKSLPNLEVLLNFEKDNPKTFINVMRNFSSKYRETLDKNGKPVKRPLKEALEMQFLKKEYKGVTERNLDIAEEFGARGLPQEFFDEADRLREKAQTNNIPRHILGKKIKEETILDSIEKIKKETGNEINAGMKDIEKMFNEEFSYEWLDKHDFNNSIMGLLCNCCASIKSNDYGENIAMSSILAPDVQNLVVRDSKDEIIAKGTMYVNKEKSYAVINEYEINEKYKKYQNEYVLGEYEDDYLSGEIPEEMQEARKNRTEIFKTLQRGLKAFIEEYDKQNPDKPLKQVNIGTQYNKLKKQVEEFKKASSNLEVPVEYGFEDAKSEQYILYKRKERSQKDRGQEK